MAITSQVYPATVKKILMGDLTWEALAAADWSGRLIQDSYTPDDADEDMADVTPYATGGTLIISLTETDPTLDAGAVTCDASDASLNFGAVTNAQVIGGMAVFAYTGTESTEAVICICDFVGGNVTGDGSNDVIITYGTNGIWRLTYTPF